MDKCFGNNTLAMDEKKAENPQMQARVWPDLRRRFFDAVAEALGVSPKDLKHRLTHPMRAALLMFIEATPEERKDWIDQAKAEEPIAGESPGRTKGRAAVQKPFGKAHRGTNKRSLPSRRIKNR